MIRKASYDPPSLLRGGGTLRDERNKAAASRGFNATSPPELVHGLNVLIPKMPLIEYLSYSPCNGSNGNAPVWGGI